MNVLTAKQKLRLGCIVLLAVTRAATGQTASVVLGPGTITTYAGNGSAGYTGDGGAATSATLNYPSEVRSDGSGNLYILDTGNAAVREVLASDGTIHTIAGTGTACSSSTAPCGDGGPAVQAQISSTTRGLFVTQSGVVYIADTGLNRIRMIDASGVMHTVAGTGTAGAAGDGGAATSAQLNAPRGVYLDGSGTLYISDSGNNTIRTVNSSGVISKFAGGASSVCAGATDAIGDGCPALSATLSLPAALWEDGSGKLYIADINNQRVRMIDPGGVMYTVAGNGTGGYSGDGGSATSAELHTPQDVVSDAAGDLYIADYANNRIRYVNVAGTITTFAGTGTAGYSGDGGSPQLARINQPHGVVLDPSGNLYILDYGNQRVRKVNLVTAAMSFGSVISQQSSTAQSVTLTSTGMMPLNITGITIPPSFKQVASGGTDCANGATLNPGAVCQLSLEFTPSDNSTQNATVTVATNATNLNGGAVNIAVSGTGIYNATVATQTTLTATPASTYPGQSVTLTATVSGAGGTPTGTVGFYAGSTLLGTVTLSSGTATLNTTALPSGTDSLTAQYSGDATFKPSTSPTTTVTAYSGPPDFSLVASTTSATALAGHSVQSNIVLTSLSGFSGALSLSCSGLPQNASCVFYPTSVTLSAGQKVTAFVTIGTTSAPPTINASIGGTKVSLGILGFFGVLFARRRRKCLAGLCTILLLSALTGAIGCASIPPQNHNVASGTYNITISAASGSVTHNATIALTVQ
ncbi:MAG TPA: Ig-like domain repeat protein [Acidisarcina sp.]|nr:Ig-like domain repeat protein [Acidisarcina sp.]